jgi:hypothetical protein
VDADICNDEVQISTFDVRGREAEAFSCLNPEPNQILSCETKLNGDLATITIVPASWARAWKPKSVREYRLHAYVQKKSNSDFYYDLFSRTLSANLKLQNLTLEGALKTGPANPDEGFFIRASFKK